MNTYFYPNIPLNSIPPYWIWGDVTYILGQSIFDNQILLEYYLKLDVRQQWMSRKSNNEVHSLEYILLHQLELGEH